MHPAEPDGFEVGPVPIGETAESGLPALLLRTPLSSGGPIQSRSRLIDLAEYPAVHNRDGSSQARLF